MGFAELLKNFNINFFGQTPAGSFSPPHPTTPPMPSTTGRSPIHGSRLTFQSSGTYFQTISNSLPIWIVWDKRQLFSTQSWKKSHFDISNGNHFKIKEEKRNEKENERKIWLYIYIYITYQFQLHQTAAVWSLRKFLKKQKGKAIGDNCPSAGQPRLTKQSAPRVQQDLGQSFRTVRLTTKSLAHCLVSRSAGRQPRTPVDSRREF